jgi:glucose/arabinose dehydrogenase
MAGETVRGNPKCGGSIARFGPDGTGYEVVAWGLRNPFGLEVDAAGQLWATSHGADVRGSRSIFGDPDLLVRVEPGAWYGWPDFFDGEPVTAGRFDAPEKAAPQPLWASHPPLTRAFASFDSHSGASGVAFSPGGTFGFAGDAFVAAFGTFAPVTTGVDVVPRGFGVVRVDMKRREVSTFARNDLPGPAFINQQDGFNRPVDVLFAADSSLWVVDWGATTLTAKGLELVPATGVVWRIYRDGMAAVRPNGPLLVQAAPLPPAQREPEVPNIPAAYKGVSGTLLIFAAGLLVVLVLVVWLLRRRRRS